MNMNLFYMSVIFPTKMDVASPLFSQTFGKRSSLHQWSCNEYEFVLHECELSYKDFKSMAKHDRALIVHKVASTKMLPKSSISPS